ncbi:glycoside hydrolase family 9 protein [[Clostridium] polysaccharolyticum]|uniref:Endoglucanase n=1 Tax=[Clostridium] polysaccharolyticum TaxID=29364 RepID=A0A1H9ZW03_9FIRM|nr:glycoside hydrolase family 9 protein [[Clostridium] polysaccharolyticum]SES85518.1 Cellulose binding domain-containing protein [[Clostridium] polysaccharolyticum]
MKHRWLKRGLATMMALTMAVVIAPMPNQSISVKAVQGQTEENKDTGYNYAKAFQLSMYFYDANMCGPQDGRLDYRYECHMEDAKVPLIPKDTELHGTNLSQSFIDEHKDVLDPDGDGCIDVSGGFHDAGDHVKFGLPQSYSGSTLGWGYYEFRDSYVKVGEQKHIEDILKHFNDYFMRCTFRDADGKVVAFCYQVGDGAADHTYWGCPEFQTTPRPVWLATSETPAADQCAGAAASLAVNYLNFKDTEPEYAEKCLDTAKALYEFAKENRGCGFSGGFYDSGYDDDELSWAAVWLNIATNDKHYITDIYDVDDSGHFTGFISKIIKTRNDIWQNMWVHSWDTVWGGVFAKLAPITDDPMIWNFFRWNIEYFSGVEHEDHNGGYLTETPGGFRVLTTWGSCRYNTAAQLCAQVYNKYKAKQEFVDWSKSQMDYILGDNPMNTCYEVGYAENSTKNPHHRASHGSTTNDMKDPVNPHHILWGALAGGPNASDDYHDDRTDYVFNEVAIDYNAAFVGALAALYAEYGEGQEPMESIPQEKDTNAFYIEGAQEQDNDQRSQVSIRIHNDVACPPRRLSGISVRYFFNIAELLHAHQSIKDVSAAILYDEAFIADGVASSISKPVAWDEENGIYYVEITWNAAFHGKRDMMFTLVAGQDSEWKSNWDASNDYSHEDLAGKEYTSTSKIPMYYDGKRVYGDEPGNGVVKPRVNASVEGIAEGKEINFTNGIQPITLKADVKNGDTVSSVEFYVNEEKAGVDTTAPYSVAYMPEQTKDEETKDLVVTAKAVTFDGIEVASKPYTITARFKEKAVPVKPPIDPDNAVSLVMRVDGKGANTETTIQRKYVIENTGTKPVDLSKVTVRYYFTKDSKAEQRFYCDAAGMQLDGDPWYYRAAECVEADFVTIRGDECYMEMSFKDLEYELQPGKNIALDTRFANANWGNMDQSNDYSFAGGDTIVMMYDGDVIQGMEP